MPRLHCRWLIHRALALHIVIKGRRAAMLVAAGSCGRPSTTTWTSPPSMGKADCHGQRSLLVNPGRWAKHSSVHMAAAAPAAPPMATAQAGAERAEPAAAGGKDGHVTQQVEAAVSESLSLLEWPSLCRQVAWFTQTPLGAELAMGPQGLPVGRTQQESEALLQETAEAQAVQLK